MNPAKQINELTKMISDLEKTMNTFSVRVFN